jgi:transposase, IS30 family
MTGRFEELQAEERVAMAALKLQGHSLRSIAEQLGRSPSIVSPEILRDHANPEGYAVHGAHFLAARHRRLARRPVKLHVDGPLWPVVSHMLGWYWSPEQIARTLRAFWPDEPSMHVSRETLYNAIYAHPKGELRKALIQCLRQGRSTRRPRLGGQDRRVAIQV